MDLVAWVDAVDNLTSVEDPNGLTTSYAYNGFGDLTTQVSPDTGTTTFTHDAAGNMGSKTDARNVTGTHSYDSINRLTSISYPDQALTFTYDSGANGLGRLTGASDSNHSMAWSYDAHGRMVSKTQTVGSVSRTVGYGYSNGNLTSVVTPSGQTISYGYTEGRITSIVVNGTTVLSGVLYEPFGSARQWAWGNGTASIRTHDVDGRVTQVDSGGEFHGYAYDDASRIVNISNASDADLTWSYDYDRLDRLAVGGCGQLAMVRELGLRCERQPHREDRKSVRPVGVRHQHDLTNEQSARIDQWHEREHV
jgi:YD repeat-containing protein